MGLTLDRGLALFLHDEMLFASMASSRCTLVELGLVRVLRPTRHHLLIVSRVRWPFRPGHRPHVMPWIAARPSRSRVPVIHTASRRTRRAAVAAWSRRAAPYDEPHHSLWCTRAPNQRVRANPSKPRAYPRVLRSSLPGSLSRRGREGWYRVPWRPKPQVLEEMQPCASQSAAGSCRPSWRSSCW